VAGVPNLVPTGLRSLTIRVVDVRVGDVLEDRESGLEGQVAAIRITPRVVIFEMRGQLDWRYAPRDLVQLRHRDVIGGY
jgi:hypothetical protein